MRSKILGTFMMVLGMAMLFSIQAAAYLDPSAMTYVIQVIAGVVIASGAALIIYWRKIKLFFKKRKMNKKK
jgi:hypothetical protein